MPKKKNADKDEFLNGPSESDSDVGDEHFKDEVGVMGFDARNAVSANPKVSRKEVQEYLNNSSQDSTGESQGSQSPGAEDADPDGVEEAGPAWIYSEHTKKKHLKWARHSANSMMMWPARVLPDDEINMNPHVNNEDLGAGKVVIEWLGTADRNVMIQSEDLVVTYGSPNSETTQAARDQFNDKVKSSKKRGQKSFRKDIWLDGEELLERAFEQAEIRLEAFRKSTKTPKKMQGDKEGGSGAGSGSAQKKEPKRKKRAYSEYVEVLPDVDVTLHVGDTIAYNDSSRTAGTAAARRITKIMQIFSKRKRPLELQNDGLVERNDFVQLCLRADGSRPPAELRRNQELGKFKLARGEARLKARTKQDELTAAARRIQGQVSQVMKDYANGKDFSEEAEGGGSGSSSSSSGRGRGKKKGAGSSAKCKTKKATKPAVVRSTNEKRKPVAAKKREKKPTAAGSARKNSKAGASASKKRIRVPEGKNGKVSKKKKRTR